jgi:tetratricopeptide (TPR) repeat protein
MRRIIVVFIILFFCLNLANTQSKKTLKEFFVQAESHYLFGEYELANPLYLSLYDLQQENANIQYKIGNCYLNIPFEETKAIPYLEMAIRNANYDANEESYKETQAPLDAYFSLGNAYRVNNELDKAINTYKKFMDLLTTRDEMVNADFIDQQILACQNAKKLIETPVKINKENLGEEINIVSLNLNPAVSGDESSLVYTCKFGEEDVIYYSRKESGEWTIPIDITHQIGSDRDCSSTSLNYDGTELYIYKIDDFIGNIYVSYFENGQWGKIQKLNRNINTKYYESHASISKDGKTLYFGSNREGGFGGLDIYKSERSENGDWGPAVNLGSNINTPFNENTPFITSNDSVLYFSSEGHFNMGGYDVFRAKNQKNEWGKPENVGYPINSTDDNLFFQPVQNGAYAYYSMLEGYKSMGIYRLSLFGKEIKRIFEIKGTLSLQDTIIEFNEKFYVSLLDTAMADTLDVSFPNKQTGYYSFLASNGNYKLIFEGLGYKKQEEFVSLPVDFALTEIVIDVELEPDTAFKREAPPPRRPILDFSTIPIVEAIDSTKLIENAVVRDVDYVHSEGEEILFYTVQLMALKNPVDVSYFKEFNDVSVVYSDEDKFYRYTTGKFDTLEEARAERLRIIDVGYLDVFTKKVYREVNKN